MTKTTTSDGANCLTKGRTIIFFRGGGLRQLPKKNSCIAQEGEKKNHAH